MTPEANRLARLLSPCLCAALLAACSGEPAGTTPVGSMVRTWCDRSHRIYIYGSQGLHVVPNDPSCRETK